MYNILVTGAKGQLGSELNGLARYFKHHHFFFTDIHNLDICDLKAVIMFVKNNQINVIINCAAYTAVDLAESNVELANHINHIAVRNLAMIAKEEKCKLIHISTDYIFDGTSDKPYCETDEPNPQSVYGFSKLAGEKAIINQNPANTIIIRTSWVYSSFGHNFVKTMLKISKERTELNVVSDQFGSPTYARDLAYIILENIQNITNKHVEIYHYTNDGICSWFEFAQAIFKIKNINCKVDPITTNNYPTPAKRPLYSVLNKDKIKNTFQLTIPHWEDSLKVMLMQSEI